MAAPKGGIFVAQWYESEESLRGPHAVTPDESLWRSAPPEDFKRALARAKRWATDGRFKSSRVIELSEDMVPISIAWASAWEGPVAKTKEGGSSGIPGVCCKLHVWENRAEGPPDHWDWVGMLNPILGNSNAWDFEYGREVATRGKMICYSIKLNLWPQGKKPPEKWKWHQIFQKDPDLQQDEIEFIRAHPIGPREFPAGSETVECAYCNKIHLRSKTWVSVEPDSGDTLFFDCCGCIDQMIGEKWYRMDPDGEEYEQCVSPLEVKA